MPHRVPAPERMPCWWVLCVAVIFHAALAVISFALVITLGVMGFRTPAMYISSDLHALIALFVSTTLYGVVGCIAFCRVTLFWLRLMAVASVLLLLLFFTTLFTLCYRSFLCGIEHKNKDDLVVRFNESRIEKCTWNDASCTLSFPDEVMVPCTSVKHFWKHVKTVQREEYGGAFVFKVKHLVVALCVVYGLFLVTVLLSLYLSLALGVREVTLQPPHAGFRYSYSRVPITDII